MTALAEYYESGTAPHEALGRAARRLQSGGALYLGGGVGIERQETGKDAPAKFVITRVDGAKGGGQSFGGPLSAVMRGLALAGSTKAADSPGGATKVADPAVAARLRELSDQERETQQSLERYRARLAAKVPAQTPGLVMPSDDSSWEARRVAEMQRELSQIRAERAALLSSGKLAEAADSMAKASTPEPFSKSKTSNWVARAGGLPAYIQHIAHDLVEKRGKSESNAIQMAIGIVKRWARGGGNVDSNTRAAASKAVAEWEAMKGRNAAKGAAKGAAKSAGKLKEAARRDALALADAGDAARERVLAVGVEAAVMLAESDVTPSRELDALAEQMRADLDAMAAIGDELGEAFSSALHPHVPHGPHGGQFAKKASKVATLSPARRGIPQGSGPSRPSGMVSTRRGEKTVHSTVNKTRTNVHGMPRAPGTGGERVAPKSQPRKLTEKELPGAVGKGRWSKPAADAVEGLHKGTLTDTETTHRLPGSGGKLGAYKPERIELHARIVRSLLQGAGTHQAPEAHFMAGGPASGKSRLLKDGKVITPKDAVDVNPDIVKTMLPEYHALVARGDKLASSKVHEESSHVAKLLMNIALEHGHHVVVDGTGNSGPGKFAAKVKAAQSAGHRVDVHYATVPTDEAVRRAAERGKKTGRNVPEGYLRSAHRDVSKRFVEDISKLRGARVRVFDTGGKKTRLLYENGRVHHRKGFEAFVGKAGEKVAGA